MLKPGLLSLFVPIGADFELSLTWKDGEGEIVDLTGWTARAQVRRSLTSEARLLTFTTENDRIVLGSQAPNIVLTAPANVTKTAQPGSGVWDLELVSPSGAVRRLLAGPVDLSGEVTR